MQRPRQMLSPVKVLLRGVKAKGKLKARPKVRKLRLQPEVGEHPRALAPAKQQSS